MGEMHKYQYQWDDSVDQKRNLVSGVTNVFPFIMTVVTSHRESIAMPSIVILLQQQLRVAMVTNILFIGLDVLKPMLSVRARRRFRGLVEPNEVGEEFLLCDYN